MSSEDVSLRELAEFLEPTTRLDVRRAALDVVINASAQLDGSAETIFQANENAIGKALCRLCESTQSDRAQTLSALTNFTSLSAEAAAFVVDRSDVVVLAWHACIARVAYAVFAAKLLSNISRHFPARLYARLEAVEGSAKVLGKLTDSFALEDDDLSRFVGFVLVNLSTLSDVRHAFVEAKLVPAALTALAAKEEAVRENASAVIRNLAFEDVLHERLLSGEDNSLIVSMASRLADTDDEYDDDEMQKLPLPLQFFEGTREPSAEIRAKLIEALYQLCSTRIGRETLRSKGVYYVLRELDRATTEPETPSTEAPKMKNPKLIDGSEHCLHALIGILIRYEEEMEVSDSVTSLRELE